MFVGAIPKPCVEQALRVVPVTTGDVYVCCSGSFRLEQGIAGRFPGTRVHSNDVSLLSTAYGSVATGNPIDFRFTGKLEFLEEAVDAVGDDPITRLGALGVAMRLGTWVSKNEHARLHFAHYVRNVRFYLEQARQKAEAYVSGLQIATFTACDFREHARRGIELGATIFAWPPTYKGGYERIYKLINENTEWKAPSYGIFDPKDLPAWLDELDALGARYCVCADHPIDGRKPVAIYRSAEGKHPVYLFASVAQGSSFRRDYTKREPFRYEVVDPWKLSLDSRVDIVRARGSQMNFLKDVYLARGIKHVTGVLNYLVYLDGKLAGGFIYIRDRFDMPSGLYVLCDFSITRERRVSKLIATLATCDETVREAERHFLARFERLTTTAFTDKPVSMKYRGVWKVYKRGPGFILYVTQPSRKPASVIYREWFERTAQNASPTATAV